MELLGINRMSNMLERFLYYDKMNCVPRMVCQTIVDRSKKGPIFPTLLRDPESFLYSLLGLPSPNPGASSYNPYPPGYPSPLPGAGYPQTYPQAYPPGYPSLPYPPVNNLAYNPPPALPAYPSSSVLSQPLPATSQAQLYHDPYDTPLQGQVQGQGLGQVSFPDQALSQPPSPVAVEPQNNFVHSQGSRQLLFPDSRYNIQQAVKRLSRTKRQIHVQFGTMEELLK